MSRPKQNLDPNRPCKFGHIQGRYKNGKCRICSIEQATRWYRENPEKAKEKERRRPKRVLSEEQMTRKKLNDTNWVKNNREKVNARMRAANSLRRDVISERARKRRNADPEKTKADQRRWSRATYEKRKLWRKLNPHVRTIDEAKRRATKLQATPTWVDKERIKEIYKRSSRISKCLGIKMHVDHIVPLRSKYVCGLHCESNLRIIPAIDNRKKKNTHWPDMTHWN